MFKINRNQCCKCKNDEASSNPSQFFSCATKNLEKYVCDECGYTSNLKIRFDKHECKELNETPESYSCQDCRNFRSYSVLLLMQHKYRKCKRKGQSDAVFQNCGQRRFQSKNVPKTESFFKDLLCKSRYLSQRTQSVSSLRPQNCFQCPYCPFKTSQKLLLKRHSTIHPRPKPKEKDYKCDRCKFVAKSQSSFEIHMNGKHASPEEITWLECNLCVYRTKWPSDLKFHVKFKHCPLENMVWFECDSCDYKTRLSSHLKRHKLVHASRDEIEWLQCDHCPYKAKCKRYMSKHIQIKHTDPSLIKWAECEFCPYKTKQNSQLKEHVLVKHTENVEWFECEHCPFKAKVKGKLKKHVSSQHTDKSGLSWIKCDQCEYSTTVKRYLKRHVQNKHSERRCN